MHSRILGTCMLISAVLLALPACGKSSQERADSTAAAQSDSSAMGGMSGMRSGNGADSIPAMTGTTTMPAMSAEMTAHMAEMKGADGARMNAMLPDHRKMANGMLSQMNDQMTSMKMSATPAWKALTDSISRDLTAMSKMSAAALVAMIPAHEMRLMNLATMHETMMKGMK